MPGDVPDFFRRGRDVLEASSTFTNRVSELASFGRFVEGFNEWGPAVRAFDMTAPRLNVLNFYGMGGIGKSTLLGRIEDTLASTGTPVERLDYQSATAFDLEDLLLRLRAAIGAHGIRCVAFDVALAYYWSVVHPGQALEVYTKTRTLAGRAAEAVGLSEQVESSLVEVVSSVASTSGTIHGAARLAHVVASLLADRRRVRHAVADCEALPMFLEAGSVEQNLTYLPALLAWDLEQAGNPRVVVLWDTYEEVAARGRATERLLQRFCYLMPNVLFVVAGRHRLDWHDAGLAGALDYVGRDAWPTLCDDAGEPAVAPVLVGDLTARDADRYLRQRLQRDGAPAIPEAVRETIVEASGGWPLYLEIAVDQFQQAYLEDRVQGTEWAVPFPALVARLTSDLTADERSVLRAAALLDSFDETLLRATAGPVAHAAVREVLAREFVRRTDTRPGVFSLHATLREAVRSDTRQRDSWSETEWAAAAGRALEDLRDRTAMDECEGGIGAWLPQALKLAHAHGLSADWSSERARRLVSGGAVDAVGDLGTAATHPAALSRLLATVAAVRELPFDEVADAIDAGLSPMLHTEDLAWATLMQADAQLSCGRLEQAERMYEEVADCSDLPADLATRASTMYSLILLKRGRFLDLEHHIEVGMTAGDSDRLLGDVRRYHAQWGHARRHYQQGLQAAVGRGDHGLARLFRSELALVDGWQGIDPNVWFEDDDAADEPWTLVSRRIAEALHALSSDPELCQTALDEAAEVARGFKFAEAGADVLVARAFDYAVHGDEHGLVRIADELEEYVATTDTYVSWLRVVRLWAGDTDGGDGVVQWSGGWAAAAAAWSRTLRDRQRRAVL